METCLNSSCVDPEWQASCLSLLMNVRNVLQSIPEDALKAYQHVPKPLTSGAIYMIYLILIFISFALSGSAITVYEFLQKLCGRKAKPHKYTGISRRSLKYEMAMRTSENSIGWLNGIKSFLSCFCILSNGRKLFSTTSNKDQFECINGIRFLSNIWIILLHICMANMSTMRDIRELKPVVEMWSSQIVMNGQYAVDAFFVLGGFLNAYLFFKNYNRSNGNVSWLYFYFKRFIRLTPVYMIVLGFLTFLFPYMGSGPIWPTFDTNPICRRNWWWNLLYIHNFQDYNTQCMEWCWYLSADMQFYVISPIFLIALMRKPKLGYILTGACIVASCLTSFMITRWYSLVDGFSRMEYHFDDLDSFYEQYWMYFDLVYIKPYARITSYLVAILLAHYLYQTKLRSRCSQRILFLGWMITGILWYIAYFALFKREESIIENAVYNGVKHLFYSVGLSWIIFLCLTKQGGLMNRFLSWKVFAPLAKLSYCAYLVHPLLLMRYYQVSRNLEDLSASSELVLSAYTYFWTYVFSFITCLLFEFPFLNLLDLMSKRTDKKRLD